MEEFTVFLLLAEKTIKTIIFRCLKGYSYGYASACPDKRRYSFRRLVWTWWWYWWIGGLPFLYNLYGKIFRRTFSSYPALIELPFTHVATLLVKNMFFKKGVLTNFVKFTGKHLCQSLFFNKVAGLLLKKGHWHRCFPVNIAKFLRTPFLTEHPRWLLLQTWDLAAFPRATCSSTGLSKIICFRK